MINPDMTLVDMGTERYWKQNYQYVDYIGNWMPDTVHDYTISTYTPLGLMQFF